MPKKLSALKVASLNIRGKAASNSDELGKLLKSEKVDIIGLQEVLSGKVNVKDFVWCERRRCPRSQVGSGRTNQGVINQIVYKITSFRNLDRHGI